MGPEYGPNSDVYVENDDEVNGVFLEKLPDGKGERNFFLPSFPLIYFCMLSLQHSVGKKLGKFENGIPCFFEQPVDTPENVESYEVDFDEEVALDKGYKLLTAEDVMRAKTVFESVSTAVSPQNPTKFMKKDQFLVAVSLLGVKKSEAEVKELFDGTGDDYEELGLETGQDLLSFAQFIARINASRSVNISATQREKVEHWFLTMYELMCENDDQRTEEDGKPYLLVRQFREILQEYGHRISSEEANAIIRSCRPIKDPLNEFDEGMGRIFFGQYQSMLLDEGV